VRPCEYVEKAMGGLDEAILEKVLHSTAARIYGIE
jgi:hypothetical protein